MSVSHIPVWWGIPFLLLLTSIAVLPLIKKGWWAKFYPVMSIGLAVVTMAFYILFMHRIHPIVESGFEYISFIALIGSLYVIAGGIHIRLRGRSRPLTNAVFLAIGAIVANLVGTTGASMIMIRPFIRVNKYRIKAYHIIFFVFIVSNVGGALTPIGDPPLFVGYLKGVPFFWSVANLWHIWLFAVATLLLVFYVIDRRDFSRLNRGQQEFAEETGEEGQVEGLHNILFLLVVLGAVFVQHPLFLRELIMLAAAAGSYFTTPSDIHKRNDFDFAPIKEVAILFAGIFITMVPALEWIAQHAAAFGFSDAGHFYWTTGALSSVLDNTPTYLNFLSAATGMFVNNNVVHDLMILFRDHGDTLAMGTVGPEVRSTIAFMLNYHPGAIASGVTTAGQVSTGYLLATRGVIVRAISVGAVFFGAMTYIGNGPNFMVKSIAEQTGVRTPSFISYMAKFSVPILLPILVIVWLLFFHG